MFIYNLGCLPKALRLTSSARRNLIWSTRIKGEREVKTKKEFTNIYKVTQNWFEWQIHGCKKSGDGHWCIGWIKIGFNCECWKWKMWITNGTSGRNYGHVNGGDGIWGVNEFIKEQILLKRERFAKIGWTHKLINKCKIPTKCGTCTVHRRINENVKELLFFLSQRKKRLIILKEFLDEAKVWRWKVTIEFITWSIRWR